MPDTPAAESQNSQSELARLHVLCHRFEGSIRVLQLIGSSLDLAEVLGHFDREARRLAAFDRLSLLLHLDDEPEHVRLVGMGEGGSLVGERIRRAAARGMQVLGERRPLKRQLWPGEFGAPDDARNFAAGIRTVLEVPLSLPDAPLGVVTFGSFDLEAFSSAEMIVLDALAASLGQAVANCRRVERLEAEIRSVRARAGQPGVTEGIAPDAVRAYLGDHLHQTADWFSGMAQGLVLAGALDTYQVERLEDWWNEAAIRTE